MPAHRPFTAPQHTKGTTPMKKTKLTFTPAPALVAMRLKDGSAVKPGEMIADHRGQEWLFLKGTRARNLAHGHSGKVLVADEFNLQWEFYDTVFDLVVTEVSA